MMITVGTHIDTTHETDLYITGIDTDIMVGKRVLQYNIVAKSSGEVSMETMEEEEFIKRGKEYGWVIIYNTLDEDLFTL